MNKHLPLNLKILVTPLMDWMLSTAVRWCCAALCGGTVQRCAAVLSSAVRRYCPALCGGTVQRCAAAQCDGTARLHGGGCESSGAAVTSLANVRSITRTMPGVYDNGRYAGRHGVPGAVCSPRAAEIQTSQTTHCLRHASEEAGTEAAGAWTADGTGRQRTSVAPLYVD